MRNDFTGWIIAKSVLIVSHGLSKQIDHWFILLSYPECEAMSFTIIQRQNKENPLDIGNRLSGMGRGYIIQRWRHAQQADASIPTVQMERYAYFSLMATKSSANSFLLIVCQVQCFKQIIDRFPLPNEGLLIQHRTDSDIYISQLIMRRLQDAIFVTLRLVHFWIRCSPQSRHSVHQSLRFSSQNFKARFAKWCHQ